MLVLQKVLRNIGFTRLLEKCETLDIRVAEETIEGVEYVLFKYGIKSPWRIDLVRECRGIILDKNTQEIVCHPYHKFGNYGESYVPKDFKWKGAYISEKIDGSLMKVWYHNKHWHISTNGTIDASGAGTKMDINFKELFMRTIGQDHYKEILYDIENGTDITMEYGFTHLFELCTFENIVVINYGEDKLFYLGSIETDTYKTVEFNMGSGVPTPKQYYLDNLEDCIEAVENFGKDQEGVVVTDEDDNRLKIKSVFYVTLHHEISNCNSPHNILGIVIRGEMEEFLTYFPHLVEEMGVYEKKWECAYNYIKTGMFDFDIFVPQNATRKEIAMWIMKHYKPISSILFSYYDKQIENVEDWVATTTPERIIKSNLWGYAIENYIE